MVSWGTRQEIRIKKSKAMGEESFDYYQKW